QSQGDVDVYLARRAEKALGYRGHANASFQPTTKPDVLHDFNPLKSEYIEWTKQEGKRLGLVDKGESQLINAFRHTFTTALLALKYGGTLTSELGWLNEQKDFNVYASLHGDITLDKIADTNADLLNDQYGIDIANQLIKEKGALHVTINDI